MHGLFMIRGPSRGGMTTTTASVTRLGDFCWLLVAIFHTKVAQTYGDFIGLF